MAVILSALIPNSEELLRLAPGELALSLMTVLLPMSSENLNLYNLQLANTFIQGYPPKNHDAIKQAISGAWEWLRGQGYLAQSPSSSDPNWVMVTPQGRRWRGETFTTFEQKPEQDANDGPRRNPIESADPARIASGRTPERVSPPIIVKVFGAPAIAVNGDTTLTFTITNPNSGSGLTSVGFTDILPRGLAIANPSGLVGSWAEGVLLAEAGSDRITLSDSVLAASNSCRFQLHVTATTVGMKNNTTSNITSKEGGNGGRASASIRVTGVPPEITSEAEIKRETDWITKATISQFSEQVRAIIYRADRIRNERNKSWVHTEDMLLSLAAEPGGQFSRLLAEAKVNLESIIKDLPDDLSETSSESAVVSNTVLPRISPSVRRALAIARDKADEVMSEVIEESHVLFGILSITHHSAVEALNSLGVEPNKVRLAAKELQEDSSKASEPATEQDGVENSRRIATYQSEEWNGRDLLNIRRDVNALASLVAGWSVQPPLSIGLFGEWGSGKSFFMRQMRKRVKQLALAAQTSRKPQRECAYYKNIAQIEFNAWHYMEGNNLWACLVQHIFSNLGLPQDTTATQIENRRKHILEQIGIKKSLEHQAEGRRRELEAKRVEAERRATEARTELGKKGAALEHERSNLWEKLKAQLGNDVGGVLQSISDTAQLHDSVETVRKFSQDAQSLAGRASLLWNLFRHDPQRRKILLWILGGSAVTLVLVRLIHLAAPHINLLVQPAFQALVPIASALAATAMKFRPVLQKIQGVISFFEKENREITEAIAKAERAQRQQITNLETEVSVLSQSIVQAEKEQREQQDAITTLESELAATDSNRLLAEFINSRASADDYRKHLGIVALVRSDFERLSDFFRAQREDEQNGKERLDDNTVNRIILYIDDLDRCPPETVVNMLQAIHLLLAFPIFVVVVAVDSRWVSRSLERCYSWLVPATPSAPMLRTERNDTDWAQAGPGATALDYLEKIFQIPFWLAPMKGPECQRLIRGLTQAASQDQARLAELIARANEQSPTAKHVAATPEEEPATLKAVSDLAQPLLADPLRTPPPLPLTPSLIPPPNAAKVLGSDQDGEADFIDLSPRQLEVEESELQKIEELATLVGRSPRVAKRFLNCYRLLKARMNEDELQKFLADQFRHVTEVLAIIVGVPHLAADVLYVLSKDSVAVDGKALVEQLTKTVGAAALSTGEGAEIVRLLGLASANHLKSLRNVVQLVSRFSFETESKRAGKGPKGPQKKAKAQRFDA